MKECNKPHCNCLEIAEAKAGGPVQNYPCLADKNLGVEEATKEKELPIEKQREITLKYLSGLQDYLDMCADTDTSEFKRGVYNSHFGDIYVAKELIDKYKVNSPARTADKNIPEQPRFFAVEYAGFWNIQSGPSYGDKNILDAEKVGRKESEQYAKLIVEFLNKHHGNS